MPPAKLSENTLSIERRIDGINTGTVNGIENYDATKKLKAKKPFNEEAAELLFGI